MYGLNQNTQINLHFDLHVYIHENYALLFNLNLEFVIVIVQTKMEKIQVDTQMYNCF